MLPARLLSAIDTRRLRSFDGTEIAYHVTEAPSPDAPWVILANGLGANHIAWRGQIEYLRDRYRFATWDYRGLYESERPRPDRAEAYEVAAHVRDLEALLAVLRIQRAAFVGWSTGVQVMLEAFARLPGRAANLVLVNGAGGRPLHALAPIPGAPTAILTAVELLRRAHVLSPIGRKLGRREASQWLHRLGLLRGTLEETELAALTSAFGKLDADALLRNIRAFADHDALPVLPGIDVPTLIVAGDRDPVTPREVAQQMARRIDRAELFVVRGGSHYTTLEFPELLALRMERFFRENGF